MTDLVTITCNRDFNQMLLQARSVEKYLKHGTTHWVFVNEEEKSLFDIDWESELKSFYTNHKLNVIYCDPSYWSLIHNGWVIQQIHKLEAVKIVEDDYLLLDSKNFFTVPTDLSTWTHHGSGVVISKKINPVVWEMWDRTNIVYGKFLGVPKIKKYYAPETPFFIKKEVAEACINKPNFPKWFASVHETSDASEFLYYSYFLKMFGYDISYNRRHCAIWPVNDNIKVWFEQEDFKLMEISGIHRTWTKNATARSKKEVANWLRSLDLIRNDEEERLWLS